MIAAQTYCFHLCDNIMLETVVRRKYNAQRELSKALPICYASNEQNVAYPLQPFLPQTFIFASRDTKRTLTLPQSHIKI